MSQPSRRPNILLITTDQQRGDCLGLEGHPVLQTPNIDFIGGSGTHFRRAYAESPSCIPARRTLISGQSPAANGMVGYQGRVEWEPAHTLPGELSRAGYQCELVGKLHLWPARKRYGFHRVLLADATRGPTSADYLDWLGGAVPIERWAMAHGATPNGWIGRPSHLPETQTHAFWCVTQAIELLAKRDPTLPFFLYVSFIDPHPPFTPPQFYYDRYVSRELPKPVVGDWVTPPAGPIAGQDPEAAESYRFAGIDEATMHYCRAAYFGLINHVDSQVGRLVQYLRDSRLFEETFILFASDHGEMLGDQTMFGKIKPFEPSARVPLLARAPGTMDFPTRVVSSAPVGLQDVMPTLLEVAGAPIPSAVTGRSLLPLMRGEPDAAVGWRDALHGEHAPLNGPEEGVHYVVDGHAKYVWYSQTGRELLFDLDRDPEERHDLLREPDADRRVAPWRQRLIGFLRDRPEGFTDGERLITGRPHRNLIADAAAEAAQRAAGGVG
jgi:arylsulfatase